MAGYLDGQRDDVAILAASARTNCNDGRLSIPIKTKLMNKSVGASKKKKNISAFSTRKNNYLVELVLGVLRQENARAIVQQPHKHKVSHRPTLGDKHTHLVLEIGSIRFTCYPTTTHPPTHPRQHQHATAGGREEEKKHAPGHDRAVG